VPDTFATVVGGPDHLLRHYGTSPEQIVSQALWGAEAVADARRTTLPKDQEVPA
jgi:hypothetical protein